MSSSRYIDKIDSYIPALDGVRGWAIILVLFVHTFGVFPRSDLSVVENFVKQLSGYGRLGVDLFFVLSGFLITGILLNSRNKPRYFLNFYAKRTLRIFPLYYIYLSCVFFITPLFVDYFNSQLPTNAYLIYYLYMQNFLILPEGGGLPEFLLGVMWSLAIEEHFYLIWPAAVYFSTSRRTVRNSKCFRVFDKVSCYEKAPYRFIIMIVFFTVAALCIRTYIFHFTHIRSYWAFSWTICRIDSILVGSLLAVCLRTSFRTLLEEWRNVIFCVFFTLTIMTMFMDHYLVGYKALPATNSLGYTIYALFFASIINVICFVQNNNWFVAVFDNKLMRLYGKHSYAIYVIHTVVNALVWSYIFEHRTSWGYFPVSILFFLICVITSLLLSLVIWHCIEKHFLRLKTFFGRETIMVDKVAPQPVPVQADL